MNRFSLMERLEIRSFHFWEQKLIELLTYIQDIWNRVEERIFAESHQVISALKSHMHF